MRGYGGIKAFYDTLLRLYKRDHSFPTVITLCVPQDDLNLQLCSRELHLFLLYDINNHVVGMWEYVFRKLIFPTDRVNSGLTTTILDLKEDELEPW